MSKLRILPLGGMGTVTQNMFAYEYEDEIMLVDCGIGFPDIYMPGVDVLIPDISYIHQKLEEGKNIVGMVLSHGHDDHIGALPYLLPEMPIFPLYASPLTAAFAQNRMAESAAADRFVEVMEVRKEYKIGTHFTVKPVAITHSVPDTRHLVITTPAGVIYHGSDFKLDPNPVDGKKSDLEEIAKVGEKGVLCMMVDCLRVERSEKVKSESEVGPAIYKSMEKTTGKYIITLMSSHIHRIQQVVNAAEKLGRKVAFVGRSVEQNVEAALALKALTIPAGMMLDKREIGQEKDGQVCVVVAGSQGQEGSSLVRAIYGDHPMLQIGQHDNVVFSADAIPGNDVAYFAAIDELCRNGINVEYPDINPDLHQSGHASALEQRELLALVKPKYVMPIGGADRHRVKFIDFVAKKEGYEPKSVLLPGYGQVIEFDESVAELGEVIDLQPINVDGLGVGDVGSVVLADRRTLGDAGIIVLVIPRRKGKLDLDNIEVVSRGFVFMKEAEEVIDFIQKQTAKIIKEVGPQAKDNELKRAIEKRLGRKLDKIIKRSPMIVPLFINLS